MTLAQARRLALALPDAAESPHHKMTSVAELLQAAWSAKAPRTLRAAVEKEKAGERS